MPERNPKPGVGRRRWAYGVVDLLVVAACSLVFVLVVTAGKPAPSRKSAVDETMPGGPTPAAFPVPGERARPDRVRRI